MADTVVTLPGDPPEWPATVRDLVRAASEGGHDRTAALAALAGDQPPNEAAEEPAERRLAFLEAADILTCDADACRPGDAGREYLQTHDEAVLFAALADAVDGFEPLVEALAVRPLTDVEAADLLSAERAADVDAAAADRHLAWLRALGYISRRDGVNDLTRAGRRLVATTDWLTPPGGQDAATATGAQSDDDSPTAITTCEGMTPDARDDGEWAVADGTELDGARRHQDSGSSAGIDSTSPDADSTSTGSAGSDAGDAELVVDADLERELRARYDDTCMLCGARRQRGPDAGYAEVHFLMPRTAPHDGPADPANALVVCPNHRADLEHGTVTVDPQSLTVEHAYESTVSGRTIQTAEDHDVGAQYLAYHNDVIAGT